MLAAGSAGMSTIFCSDTGDTQPPLPDAPSIASCSACAVPTVSERVGSTSTPRGCSGSWCAIARVSARKRCWAAVRSWGVLRSFWNSEASTASETTAVCPLPIGRAAPGVYVSFSDSGIDAPLTSTTRPPAAPATAAVRWSSWPWYGQATSEWASTESRASVVT